MLTSSAQRCCTCMPGNDRALPCCVVKKMSTTLQMLDMFTLSRLQVCTKPAYHLPYHRLRIRYRHHFGRRPELPEGLLTSSFASNTAHLNHHLALVKHE